MAVEKEWELLGVILTRITELYGRYREVLLAQRRAVIENRIQDLQIQHGEIEAITESLVRLEQRRLGHMKALAEAADREILNIKDLAVAYPQLDGVDLQAKASALKAVVAEVRKLTRTNADMIEMSRKVVKVTMHTIMSQNVDPRDKAWRTYGALGTYARTVKREPVHLVNRRG